MCKVWVMCFAVFAGWVSPASAGFFSATGPVIAILADDLFQGEAKGNLDGSGTIKIQSRAKPEVSCYGQFTSSAELGGAGNLRCSDGVTSTFQFQRLSVLRGYGTGSSSRGPMSFTYGLSANDSEPYLKLPPGKGLKLNGKDLLLVDVKQPAQASLLLPVVAQVAPLPEAAPDVLLSTATLVVTANLKQDKNLLTNSPEKLTELVEATVLPLFDFRHMTQLAVARNWRLASPEQQTALIAEFKTLLVRTYSTALTNYRGQAIEYKPLRMTQKETEVTVKSTVKQPGAERLTIDYDMEKTATGWKVYDIRIAGISLVTTYRSTFSQTVRDDGVDGLIKSLSDKNRQINSGLSSHKDRTRPLLFIYAAIANAFYGGR